jgi:WD40 repeat protein
LPVTGITALSPVGDTIAVIEDDGSVSFWSARSGEQIGTAAVTIPGAGGLGWTPEAVAEIGGVPVFSADGTKLYLRDADGRFSIVEVSTGDVVDEFELPVGRTHRALAVSGDSIATGHSDGTVMLWDAATFGSTDEPVATWQLADQVGECAPPGNPRLDGIRRLSIRESTGGLEVIVVDQCDVGIGWRILDGEPTRAATFTNSRVVDFGPDGSYVRSPVTARLQLFSNDGSEGRNFDAHRGPIRQTSLSYDGSTMASVSDDMIGLWYTASGEILATGITGAQAHVASDGLIAVTSGAAAFDWFGGPVVVWDLDPDTWQERACESAGRNLSFFEWEQFFPDEAYRITCPQWPSGL